MNNIFVKDAIETKNKLNEINKDKKELLILLEPIDKKLGFKKYKNIEKAFTNLSDLNDQNKNIEATIKDKLHQKEILENNIKLNKEKIKEIEKIISEYQSEKDNLIYNKTINDKISKTEIEMEIEKNKQDIEYNKMIEEINEAIEKEKKIKKSLA